MSNVARKVIAQDAPEIADLTEETTHTKFSESTPVLATPAAAAAATAGATLAAGSAVGGYLAEEAADG